MYKTNILFYTYIITLINLIKLIIKMLLLIDYGSTVWD